MKRTERILARDLRLVLCARRRLDLTPLEVVGEAAGRALVGPDPVENSDWDDLLQLGIWLKRELDAARVVEQRILEEVADEFGVLTQ